MSSRQVGCRVALDVTEPADLVFSVAVSDHVEATRETMAVTVGGEPVELHEIKAANGTRLHRLAPGPVGELVLDYSAEVPASQDLAPVSDHDEILYLRPSRYCDSDRLAAVAATHFGGQTGQDLVEAVRAWTLANITYAPGSTGPVDGALDVYLSRMGVCRDTAQLVITFLRAQRLPARLVSVYAPGLVPMDFHAVAEVLVDGVWRIVDGTGLAPRTPMVRIATGRDAADSAFLTVNSGRATLIDVQVNATGDGDLPVDDGTGAISIA